MIMVTVINMLSLFMPSKVRLKKQSHSLLSDIAPVFRPIFKSGCFILNLHKLKRKTCRKWTYLKKNIFGTVCRHLLRGSRNRISKSIKNENPCAIMDTKSNQICIHYFSIFFVTYFQEGWPVKIRFEETFPIYLCFHEIDKISFQQYLLTTKCQILTLKHKCGGKWIWPIYVLCIRYVASYVRKCITFPKYDSHLFVCCMEK